ncbi:HAD family hydrolase [Salinarimonas sp.]|uniref:HAD family hydrolase n=1 Tax=Salinarimonas sp. TaxID=2766526 RepID=UPI00391AABE7
MRIEAIVFDMDGVLIDAKDWHYRALNRALELFGYTIDRAEHLSTFDGLPTRRKLELLSEDRGLPRGLHGFLSELKQIYTIDQVHADCRPLFVHEYALSNLKSRGYRLALASNSVRRSVELMMEKSGLAGYFDVMLSNEDIVRPKPSPDIYLRACELVGVEPSRALVVEDNVNGIRAAEAAGCPVLVVRSVEEVELSRLVEAVRRAEERAA